MYCVIYDDVCVQLYSHVEGSLGFTEYWRVSCTVKRFLRLIYRMCARLHKDRHMHKLYIHVRILDGFSNYIFG